MCNIHSKMNGDNSSDNQRSHADRIRDEVNRLLPDISFDDVEDETNSTEDSIEPIEIFSRGSYLNDLDDYDLEKEDDEGDVDELDDGYRIGAIGDDMFKEVEDDERNAFPSDRSPQDDLQTIFGGLDASTSEEQPCSTLESLMKTALSQLMTSDIAVPNTNGNGKSDLSETIGSRISQQSSKRVSFDESSNRVHSIDVGRSIVDNNQKSQAGRLFGGLSGDRYDEARTRYLPDTIVTLNFGIRGEVDLDQLLNSMETPDVDISHYYDVEMEEKEEKNSALLKKLESMSRQYSAIETCYTPSSSKSSASPGQATTAPTRRAFSSSGPSSTNGNSGKIDFSDSTDDVHKRVYIDFIPQYKQNKIMTSSASCGTSTNNMGTSTSDMETSSWGDITSDFGRGNRSSTIFIDLRNAAPKMPNSVNNSALIQPPILSSSESSSSDDESGGLWLDRHRRSRTVVAQKSPSDIGQTPEQPVQKVKTCEEEKNEIEETPNVSISRESARPSSPATVTVSSMNAGGTTNVEPEIVSDRVKKKIKDIKRREEELSQRRRWGHILNDILERNGQVNESVFHEEFSFTSPIPVVPIDVPSAVCTLKFELRAPGELITVGKRPRPVDDGRGVPVCHAALLTWLLSLTRRASPFKVIGLQQSSRGQRLITHVGVSASQGVSSVQRYLSANSLRDVLPKDWLHPVGDVNLLSGQSLSTFVSVQTGWEWRTDGCFSMTSLVSTERIENWKCLDKTEIGVVTLQGETISHGGRVISLLLTAQRSGLDLVGIRLLHPIGELPILALAWRGHEGLQRVRNICGPGPQAILTGIPNWEVTRFSEMVSPNLARYFGARIITPTVPSEQAIQAMMKRQQNLLIKVEPSDLLLLLSPAIADVSWLLRVAHDRGMDLVGARRVHIEKNCAEEEFGMSAAQTAVYTSDVSHLLILRQANAMGHAASFIQEAYQKLYEGQVQKSSMPHSSLLFYAMPCLPSLLSCFGKAELNEVPSIPDHDSEDVSFSDEQYIFVAIHGSEFRRLLVEVLDQIARLEILGIKCLPMLLPQHGKLLSECFGRNINSDHGTAFILLRGIGVTECLQEACKHSSGNILMSRSLRSTVRLTKSFFFEWEIFAEPRRRRLASMLPHKFLKSEGHIFSAMTRAIPDMKVLFKVKISDDVNGTWGFGKIWKTLENENFTVEDVHFIEKESLQLILHRVNAVYHLAQCAKTKLSSILGSSNLIYPSSASEAEAQLSNFEHSIILTDFPVATASSMQHYASISNHAIDDYQELGVILVTSSALNRVGRSKSGIVHVLEMLSNKKFEILSCQTYNLEENASRQLNSFDIISLDDDPKTSISVGAILCIVFQGVMACIGIRQMLKCNSAIQKIGSSIFTAQSQQEVLRISSSLLTHSC